MVLSSERVPYVPIFESMLDMEKMEVFDFLSIRVTIIFQFYQQKMGGVERSTLNFKRRPYGTKTQNTKPPD